MKPARIQRRRTTGYDMQAASRAANGLPRINVCRPSTSAANAKVLFDMNRKGIESQKGSALKDEPGLGATAFSTTTKKNAVLIFFLKGNANGPVHRCDLTNMDNSDRFDLNQPAEGKQVPAGFLDKLRVVAKNAAGRM